MWGRRNIKTEEGGGVLEMRKWGYHSSYTSIEFVRIGEGEQGNGW